MTEQQFSFETHNAVNVEKQGKTYLLFCPPGMGKSHTIGFLPGKTLVLDIDRTSHVLKGNPNIDIIYVDNKSTWDYWEKLLIHIEKNLKGKYDNIAIDNASELERCLLSSLGAKGKNNGVPSQGDYQYMQFRIVNSFRWMKNLADRVVFTAWETTDLYTSAEGQQYNRSYPQINMKILNNVLGLCDVVGRLMINSEGNRGYVLKGTNSIYAKNQLDGREGCKQDEIFAVPSTNDEEKGANK
ncbi:AAA family ATPase [Viridibacillus sp. FSL R5-0477]|uniref:ATPase involved in DNA replication initiation n=1 Tax=Viridibacillus arenosi FSL R5-213 TaxID=1227360 RepID=W4EWI7_9BACL|nr:AAA family ATPase [Viridibacillus arenosi]ETT84201.1 ATPase involved in DNA replication initiation [Viridibacillus arenosi FSL R5-213]OMC90006.1 DNA-binding protein [Viridibacillus arenosi]